MSLSFDGQRILILGAGVTGNAVARSLIKRGAVVSITDEILPLNQNTELLMPRV